ncbi:MAG: glycoside hydrolase family 78 protein [Tepidisphaeraceae bacterium]
MSAVCLPVSLRTEYLPNPLGLDEPRPRLSWKMRDDRRGAKQSAYQVQVADSPDAFNAGKLRWDSGRVAGDQSIHIDYAGPAVASRARVFWRVKLWDHAGIETPWSETAFWETGLLDRSEWTGDWIASPHTGGPYTPPPVPYVRKTFDVGKTIARARLYATGLGIYEFELNGRRVDDAQFLPGRTEYQQLVQYQVFDVTTLIGQGGNAIGAILGDGWYCGHLHSDPRQYYGDRPKLLAQLVLDFTDGTSQTIATDGTWKTATGPIRSSDMLMGEDYDARLEITGWSSADFDASRWEPVAVMADPGIAIVPMRSQPVRKIQEIVPKQLPVVSANKRRWIFDLGQNFVGHVRLKMRNQPAGQTVDLRHVEMLDANGKPYVTALRTARATDHYTTRGGAEETFEPRFTFHGFRYVEVRDVKGQPEPDTVTGVVVHSDLPFTGTFECSDPLLNQLQSNIVWSQRGNFLDFPTDCPQRDERMGWTGDAQVFIRTAAFNMEVAGFFRKWLADMAVAQFKDSGSETSFDGTKAKREPGGIPSVIPFCATLANEGGPAWSDAAVICPWTIYLCYGDTRLLAERYEMMTKFVEFLRRTSNNLIRADETNKWRGYGDWLSQNADTPKDLIGTAFTVHSAELLSNIAGVLGNADDQKKYQAFADEVRVAWQKKYIADGDLIAKTQTGYVLALHFKLVPSELRQRFVDLLVKDIESRDMHLSTGFVGTPYLTHVLTDGGRADVAYALLTQKTFPGWLFPVTHGATTMWERWDGWTPEKGFHDAGMNSYNHYAYGAVGEWMYARVAGIDLDPARPAYKHVRVRPVVGGGLTYATATYESPFGRIKSGWSIEAGKLKLNVLIPPNTTATVVVPTAGSGDVTEASGVMPVESSGSAVRFEIGAGSYEFTADWAATAR